MKRKLGTFKAKTEFSKLVGQVCSSGQTVTNRGRPVVVIGPVLGGKGNPKTREQAFREIARLRVEILSVCKTDIREWIEEGRS